MNDEIAVSDDRYSADKHLTADQLYNLHAERLGPLARALAQTHLNHCDACAEALATMIMEELPDDEIPDAVPSVIPPPDVYDRIFTAQSGAAAWTRVRDALRAARTTAWAEAQIEQIGLGLQRLLDPDFGPTAVLARGSVFKPADPNFPGVVAASAPVDSGELAAVTFDVLTPPYIDERGSLRFVLATGADTYVGRPMICTIALPHLNDVSVMSLVFEAPITRAEDGSVMVTFADEGLPATDIAVPFASVSLTIA